MSQTPDPASPSAPAAPPSASKPQRFEYHHTPNLPGLLEQLQISLVVSTYQAGKVLVLGAHQGQLVFSTLDYDSPMGVAIAPGKIAIGAGSSIHFLTAQHPVAPQVAPLGTYDGCFVPHTSRHTGKILVHDLGWGAEGLWVCNTLFSCLCTLDDQHNFVPRWKPTFISALADQDRCHLNGMAMDQGLPRFVTALAPTDTAAGWRADKARTGCLIDVASGEFVALGLCMPHSPRVHRGELFVLNSGFGHLSRVDPATGRLQPVEMVPGYTRGLGFYGQYAFVGLSRIRETNVFGGLPIGEYRADLCCGVAVIDLAAGRTVATFRFSSGIEEIFAVDVIPRLRNPALGGATRDERQNEIWIVPAQPPAHRLEPAAAASPAAPTNRPTAPPGPSAGTSVVPVDLLRRSGLQAHLAGRLDQALAIYQQALRQEPGHPDVLSLLGNLHQDRNDPAAAFECYRQSLEVQPHQPLTHRNQGVLCVARNEPWQAIRHFEMAQQAEPQAMNLLLAGQVLPVIYDSPAEVGTWRTRLTSCLDALAQSGATIDTTDSLLPTTFYLAYQGENDRPLMERLATICRGVDCCAGAFEGGWRPQGKRLRVGFMSAYFCDHTLGRLNLGLVEQLPRDRFEVTVIALKSHRDPVAEAFRSAADRTLVVDRQVARARRQIADLGLDILIFADVGMDALAQTLSHSRMAPLQGATWGHPDTTGSRAIDFFVSSDLAEGADADGHYSERLIRLPTLGIHYQRPPLEGPRRTREELGLNPHRRTYVCPQTLFKFHPACDEALSRILTADPEGDLVVLKGQNPAWMTALMARWRQTLPDADRRIQWLAPLPRRDYLHLLATADVLLDPFPFCGGNSSYEAFAVGTPLVTLPGEYLRGRLTWGMYRRMQLESLVPGSIEQYAQQAVRLATDSEYRAEHARAIAAQSPVLYENPADVQAWANALEELASRGN